MFSYLKLCIRLYIHIAIISIFLPIPSTTYAQTVVIGSKNFTESRILAEIMAQLIEDRTSIEVTRKLGLGGTLICFTALQNGEIDIYAEYTGTGWATILKEEPKSSTPLQTFLSVQDQFRKKYQIDWLMPFGLNNSYGLAMLESKAKALNIRRISDLNRHTSTLTLGLSHEFINRKDGYPGLSARYSLDFKTVRSMEHGLTYPAIKAEEVDIMDIYTTDGKLRRYALRVLEDDLGFFPPYNAAPMVSLKTLEKHPELRSVLQELAFRLPDQKMQILNYAVEEKAQSFSSVAKKFLEEEGLVKVLDSAPKEMAAPELRDERSFWKLMAQRAPVTFQLIAQHLSLTSVAVVFAILLAMPMGILIERVESIRSIVLGAAGVIQTIPSLALLALMIPIPGLGLGANAAIAALFLYALLPILRNTYTGIDGVDADLIEAARGLGLTDFQVLWHVQLPLAMPTIMAGIRTSTVISIGVATLAAFIGAGGLGEPIITGLQLNDRALILTGAVPAALLALVVDAGLGQVQKRVTPRGLNLAS